MGKERYITGEERKKCRRVVDAFAELFGETDILVLDAGRYGFVKLQYYRQGSGFDEALVFTDSRGLFEDLWDEWLYTRVYEYVKNTPVEEKKYEDVFKGLPEEKQAELLDKRHCFAEEAGVTEG